MNVKEAAKKWSIPERTVSWYCQKKYIDGITFEKGVYSMPNYARRPYISTAKKAVKILINIIDAVNKKMGIYAQAFHIEEQDMERYIQILCDANYLKCYISPIPDRSKYGLGIPGWFCLNETNAKRRRQKIISAIPAILMLEKGNSEDKNNKGQVMFEL